MNHARIILSDRPVVNAAHGLAVYNEQGEVVKIAATTRLLNDFGVVGIHRGLNTFKGQVRVSNEKFEAKNKKEFDKLVREMCEKFNFDITVSLPHEKVELPSDRG